MTRMCVTLHCLPGPGGLLDQDAFLVEVMGVVLETDQEKERIEDEKRRRKQQLEDARRRR